MRAIIRNKIIGGAVVAALLVQYLTVLAAVQLPQCEVSGYIFLPTGQAARGQTIRIVRVTKAGALIPTAAVTAGPSDSNGFIRFMLAQGSIATLYAPVTGLDWNGTAGVPIPIPNASSARLETLIFGVNPPPAPAPPIPAPPVPDTTAPTVTVAAPTVGATLSGSVSLTANAADNVGVVGVRAYVDNIAFGAEDTTVPYSFPLNTATYGNGTHTVKMVARDQAGNQATSSTITFTVSNTPASGEPALPQVYIDTNIGSTAGYTIMNVAAGGNLQAAVNTAAANTSAIGIIINVAAPGNYGVLNWPNKTTNAPIIITSDNAAFAVGGARAPGTRVRPSDASLMPKLVTNGVEPALTTSHGAHHYRLIGFEVYIPSGQALNYGIVRLGSGDSTENQASLLPHHLTIDRCYIHGNTTGDVSRAVAMNAGYCALIDSYIDEAHARGIQVQAVCAWSTPGPLKVVNNFIAGSTQNLLIGGADPKVTDMIPSDLEFRRNHFSKPLSWNPFDQANFRPLAGQVVVWTTNPAGAPGDDQSTYGPRWVDASTGRVALHWSVANIFELKNARRVLIDGNVFEGNWVDVQSGESVLFTPRNQDGTAPWCTVEDVTMTNSILRNAAAGVNILRTDNEKPSQLTKRIKISNLLAYNIGGPLWGANSDNEAIQLANNPDDVEFDHCTFIKTGSAAKLGYSSAVGSSLKIRNSIFSAGGYGMIGLGGEGTPGFNQAYTTYQVTKNVLVGRSAGDYPAGNSAPATISAVGFVDLASGNYRLASGSPYKNAATDGTDIGANIDALEAATAGAVQPQ
jgi:hypothetical protein